VAATQRPDRRAALRCAAAAATTAATLVGGAEILMPGSTAAFMAHLFAFGGGISSAQPDLAGLPGLFEHLPGGSAVGVVLAVAGVLTTVGFAGFWAFSGRAQAVTPEMRVALGVGVGMAIWLAATPYAHPNDDVLLFPLVALLVGVDGRAVRQRQRQVAVHHLRRGAAAYAGQQARRHHRDLLRAGARRQARARCRLDLHAPYALALSERP